MSCNVKNDHSVVAKNKIIENENGKANFVAEDEPCLEASVCGFW